MQKKAIIAIALTFLLSGCGSSESSSEGQSATGNAETVSAAESQIEEISSVATETTTTAAAVTTTETTTTTVVPEIIEAEKYAKIVLDNEKVWLDSIDFDEVEDEYGNSLIKPNAQCWFEDLDFDGVYEFIIGPARVYPGMDKGYLYHAYSIKGNKMIELTNTPDYSDYVNPLFVSQVYNYPEDADSFIMNIYKDKNGEIHRVFEGHGTYDGDFAFTIYEL